MPAFIHCCYLGAVTSAIALYWNEAGFANARPEESSHMAQRLWTRIEAASQDAALSFDSNPPEEPKTLPAAVPNGSCSKENLLKVEEKIDEHNFVNFANTSNKSLRNHKIRYKIIKFHKNSPYMFSKIFEFAQGGIAVVLAIFAMLMYVAGRHLRRILLRKVCQQVRSRPSRVV